MFVVGDKSITLSDILMENLVNFFFPSRDINVENSDTSQIQFELVITHKHDVLIKLQIH
jgi:hypothetical protein